MQRIPSSDRTNPRTWPPLFLRCHAVLLRITIRSLLLCHGDNRMLSTAHRRRSEAGRMCRGRRRRRADVPQPLCPTPSPFPPPGIVLHFGTGMWTGHGQSTLVPCYNYGAVHCGADHGLWSTSGVDVYICMYRHRGLVCARHKTPENV